MKRKERMAYHNTLLAQAQEKAEALPDAGASSSVDLSGITAGSKQILEGYESVDKKGQPVYGTVPVIPSDRRYEISENGKYHMYDLDVGYHDGNQEIEVNVTSPGGVKTCNVTIDVTDYSDRISSVWYTTYRNGAVVCACPWDSAGWNRDPFASDTGTITLQDVVCGTTVTFHISPNKQNGMEYLSWRGETEEPEAQASVYNVSAGGSYLYVVYVPDDASGNMELLLYDAS